MPESVKDRCTRCYEHVFLLTKSKKYYFGWLWQSRFHPQPQNINKPREAFFFTEADISSVRVKCDVWHINTVPIRETTLRRSRQAG